MSFLDQVKAWSTTAPTLPDLEATDFESGKLAERGEDNFEQSETVGRPKFRKTLELKDAKYRGAKVSRKDIFGESTQLGNLELNNSDDDDDEEEKEESDESDISEDERGNAGRIQDDDDDFSGEEALEQLQLSRRNAQVVSDDDEDADDEEDDFDDEGEEDEEEEDNDEVEAEEDDGEPSAKRSKIKVKDVLKETDNDKEHKKADDVADQLKIWDQVLYLKIKLQAAMRAFNQLPRGKLATDLHAAADEETKKNFKLARSNIKHVILDLLDAEKRLVDGSVQSKGALEGLITANSDDEEIESSEDEKDEDDDAENDGKGEDDDEEADDEEEEDDDDIKGGTNNRSAAGKKKSLSWKELESILIDREKNYSKFRDDTIKKWENRTKLVPSNKRIAKNDFSGFLKDGIVEQIRNLMRDTEKQKRKFHVKRAEGDRIGGDAEADFDEEIFDDDDFNDVLLKELIDKKAKTISDPIAMTRHYIEMKKLQNKRIKKKKYDRSFVKGRGIKYVPIPELLNFHPARPEAVKWSHEARNELYKSLFQ